MRRAASMRAGMMGVKAHADAVPCRAARVCGRAGLHAMTCQLDAVVVLPCSTAAGRWDFPFIHAAGPATQDLTGRPRSAATWC